jgi:hypothetical protein
MLTHSSLPVLLGMNRQELVAVSFIQKNSPALTLWPPSRSSTWTTTRKMTLSPFYYEILSHVSGLMDQTLWLGEFDALRNLQQFSQKYKYSAIFHLVNNIYIWRLSLLKQPSLSYDTSTRFEHTAHHRSISEEIRGHHHLISNSIIRSLSVFDYQHRLRPPPSSPTNTYHHDTVVLISSDSAANVSSERFIL